MTKLTRFVLAPVLLCALVGCQQKVVERYTPAEAPHYSQWEQETHRDHVEYEQRTKDEQRAYWEWRHHQ
jgi:hypothetical protein